MHQHRLVRFTEALLTWRKRRRERHRRKQAAKNVIVDWIEAFIWAAFVVLLINQYLLQAYQIPSGSMIETLLLGDRIFVDKLSYGPELIPGRVKLSGFADPERNDIIIFENPSYIGRGPVFDILQRIIYMLTLSLVDIDRDENGMPRAHFLIKRAVGTEGDRFKLEQGELRIQPAGESTWYTEPEFQDIAGLSYSYQRLFDQDDYPTIEQAGTALAARQLGIPISENQQSAIQKVQDRGLTDPFALELARQKLLYAASPNDVNDRRRLQRLRVGWFVPPNRVFPLGDNRDDSRDGRYFGPVRTRHVLGRALIIYWPLSRFGAIQ